MTALEISPEVMSLSRHHSPSRLPSTAHPAWLAERSPRPAPSMVHLPSFFTGLVPPTPVEADGTTHRDTDVCPVATRALLHYVESFGFAIGYDREQAGRLIQDIYPVKARERMQVSTSSRVTLGSHTETAFHPHKPDFVVLLCLRGDERAATTYADVDDVVSLLSERDIAILQQPEFVTTVDPSFMTRGESDARVIIRPLRRADGHWMLVYDELLMSALTERSHAALTRLHEAVRQATRHIVLHTGDLLRLDNSRIVHGRTPFRPRYDGTDRWLKRALVVRSLPVHASSGRVIRTVL